jgi:hypothetical protein
MGKAMFQLKQHLERTIVKQPTLAIPRATNTDVAPENSCNESAAGVLLHDESVIVSKDGEVETVADGAGSDTDFPSKPEDGNHKV